MTGQIGDASAKFDPLADAIEVIPGRLYYSAFKAHPCSFSPNISLIRGKPANKPIHFFSIDNELIYWNFFLDFGPLNFGQLFRFCRILNYKLNSDPNLSGKIICYYSSADSKKRVNAIFLICAWQVLFQNRAPDETFLAFKQKVSLTSTTFSPLSPFHDASPCHCTFDLTILDCLHGLSKARMHKFFDFDNFNLEEYEHFEQVENGDLNWIVKDKILSFASPHNHRKMSPGGYRTLTPEDYIPYFQKKNVKLVVRLNRKCYDERKLMKYGINFVEHYYLDGSVPNMKILQSVLSSFESVPEDKAFAVHCKAGLGRTGTCVGAYLMKHYKFTSAEAIGWMRICRPGSVIGPQQHFLQEIEQRMWHEGDLMNSTIPKQLHSDTRKLNNNVSFNSNVMGISKLQICSLSVSEKEDEVRVSQSEGLMSRKHSLTSRQFVDVTRNM